MQTYIQNIKKQTTKDQRPTTRIAENMKIPKTRTNTTNFKEKINAK